MRQQGSVVRTADDERTTPSQVLSERDAAKYLGLSQAWFRAGRMRGRGPAYVRTGRTVRYLARDLDLWIQAHRVVPGERVGGGR